MEMSFLGRIGHLMAGSGIKVLFEIIYAPKAVEKIMSGKAISRAVRAHLPLDTALNGLLLPKSMELSKTSRIIRQDTVYQLRSESCRVGL